VALGATHQGFRCEDLARQTFDDGSFDLVITQDVLEHLLEPTQAFSEISRTLRPGGAHVFTVPWHCGQETKVRARKSSAGIEYLEEPVYHGNPVDANGSLVATDWGTDLCDIIDRSSGMTTTMIHTEDSQLGIPAEFTEVFISRKTGEQMGRSAERRPGPREAVRPSTHARCGAQND
jgi:SAM-dependent methyltransferase